MKSSEDPAQLRKRQFSKIIKTEAVVQRCSVKKLFFEISQNSQENTFYHRTPVVAASVKT